MLWACVWNTAWKKVILGSLLFVLLRIAFKTGSNKSPICTNKWFFRVKANFSILRKYRLLVRNFLLDKEVISSCLILYQHLSELGRCTFSTVSDTMSFYLLYLTTFSDSTHLLIIVSWFCTVATTHFLLTQHLKSTFTMCV